MDKLKLMFLIVLAVFTGIGLIVLNAFAFLIEEQGLLLALVVPAAIVQLIIVVMILRGGTVNAGIKFIVVIAIIASFAINITAVATFPKRQIGKTTPDIVKHIKEYTDTQELKKEGNWDGQRSAKVLLIDMDKKAIDGLYLDLPESAKAKTRDEVETIFLLDYNKEHFGTYEGGDTAYQIVCTISVADEKTGTLYEDVERVEGPEPDYVKAGNSGDEEGSRPTGEIIDFILGIPVKNIEPGSTGESIPRDEAEALVLDAFKKQVRKQRKELGPPDYAEHVETKEYKVWADENVIYYQNKDEESVPVWIVHAEFIQVLNQEAAINEGLSVTQVFKQIYTVDASMGEILSVDYPE